MKWRAFVANLAVICVTTSFGLLLMEVTLRRLDGYQVFRWELSSKSTADAVSPDPMVERGREYAAKIVLDPSFRSDWFNSAPPVIDSKATYPLPADWAKAVAEAGPDIQKELKRLYNRNLVNWHCRTGNMPSFFNRFKPRPGFLYTFRGPDDSMEPIFRQVPHGWDQGSGSFNNFGFRGPDIPFHKGPRTIRIAALGASTTEGLPEWPTFPDHVAQMLRLWARGTGLDLQFDVVNAGRSGANSSTIAQVMRYEVAALRPDIVIWYGGTGTYNHVAEFVHVLPGIAATMPGEAASLPLERYSAIATRLRQVIVRHDDMEPPKPAHEFAYDLNAIPDVDAADLPARAKTLVADIRSAAASAKKIGAEFFIASTVVLVHKGLRVDPERQKRIWQILNVDYFPMTYAEFQEAVEYENNLVRNLSIKDHLHFLEIYKYFPQDADLFGDPFHFGADTGFRLEGWIIAQQLAPYILDAVRSGKLPRASDAEDSEIAWVKERPERIDLSCQP